MSHYEERLEKDLERIRTNIHKMGELVEHALTSSVRALLDGDVQLAHMTILGDNRINRVSRNIDMSCHEFIARHLPSAGHLRLISAVIRLNVALERVGDYAVTISRESLQLATPPKGRIARELDRVSDEAQRVLHQAMQAFDEGNGDLAAATFPMAEHIENLMDDIYAELIAKQGARSPREMVASFVVFSLLKRIADQGKNICEQTLFAVSGEAKKPKRFRVMFIDGGNHERSLMAQGVARKTHSEHATFLSAAAEPGEPDKSALEFLDSCGIETRNLKIEKLRPAQHDLQEIDIIVSLDGPVSGYIDEVPFHTSALEWKADEAFADADTSDDRARQEALYRFLKQQVDQLLDLISGRKPAS